MGRRRGALASALCALLLLGACASAPPIETPRAQNPQQARIYVMRDPEVFSEAVHPGIKVDDESVGDVAPARFLVIDRAPGQHVVAVFLLQNYYPLTLTTRPGSVHYVKVALRPYMERLLLGGIVPQAIEQASTGHNGAYTAAEMSESDGRALLQKLTAGAS
jgi:hypothetical protein